MAEWKEFNIKDIVENIGNQDYVLPVIQRRLVWNEEKMTLLFDSLLKKNAFGGVMVLEQQSGLKPLFAMRNFIKDFSFDTSLSITRNQDSPLERKTNFVIDGQQRMQTFYIGLTGSFEGKIMYFNLFSDRKEEFEFAFSNDENKLPKQEKDDDGEEKEKLWFPVPTLFQKFSYDGLSLSSVSNDIIKSSQIVDEKRSEVVRHNIEKFYLSIFMEKSIGIAKVERDGDLDDVGNRQKMVELFQRLNNGGTILSAFDLMASTLKGLDWEMETFLDKAEDFSEIGISQNELIKLLFIFQDAPNKNLANIEKKDTEFALGNQDRIYNTLIALRKFLALSKLENYYLSSRRSAVPLYLAAYHIFHRKSVATHLLPTYFDNDVTGNPDFSNLKRWFYLSLLNGVFKGRTAGWVSEKTGLNRVYNFLKNFKNRKFPVTEIFIKVYQEHRLRFSEDISLARLNFWDMDFLFYVIYGFEKHIRQLDIDHIHPKSILADKVLPEKINCVENFQLIDISTNRGDKKDKTLEEWIDNITFVPNKDEYIKRHLIPNREFWSFDKYETFLEKRAEMIVNKINHAVPSPEFIEEQINLTNQTNEINNTQYQNKIGIAEKNGVFNEFVALHEVTDEIKLWPTFLVDAIQYHHDSSGTRVLLTVYIRSGGFYIKFYQNKFLDYYNISKEELSILFDGWTDEFWLDAQKTIGFITVLGKLKSFLK